MTKPDNKPDQRPTRPTRFHGERSRWLVPSDSEDVPHFVDMDEYDGIGWCSCASHQFRCQPLLDRGDRNPKTICKHIERVIAEIGRQLRLAGFKTRQESERACQHGVVQTMNGKTFCGQCGEQL